MTKPPGRMIADLATNPLEELAEPQNREALYLLVNTLALAVGGLLFWLVVTRGLGVGSETVGRGYAIVSLGTAVGVVAKGGFDTAILRHAPHTDRSGANRLLWIGVAIGVALAVLGTLALVGASQLAGLVPTLAWTGWALVLAIAGLLVATWLLDAYFVSDREARFTVGRNLAFSVARIGFPVLLVIMALPHTVALAWALGLAASAILGLELVRRLPDREGGPAEIRAFLRTAVRNISSSAAEFLPGLVLTPIVLAIQGPEAAAYFGIAWTVAHLIFQLSAAISRSALVEFVEEPSARHPEAVRRGLVQHLLVAAPAALGAALLAPQVLGIFGAEYARLGGPPFVILCASILVVAPWYLYLSVLRARERVTPLVAFPAATVAALFALVPLLEARYGLPGVSLAWLIANAPFGIWAGWRLYREAQEVSDPDAEPVDRRPHPG